MCRIIDFPDRIVRTIGELHDMIVPARVVILDGYSEGPETCGELYERLKPFCLCPVDVAATFAASDRWTANLDENSPGDWIAERKEPS